MTKSVEDCVIAIGIYGVLALVSPHHPVLVALITYLVCVVIDDYRNRSLVRE